ncbi:hypothetical protein [Flavobacterium sp. 2]|uniref:hypothetical protein n=1 Tax=Flavobacterium sp. 2 TaxID=308053 RepID=UPI003CFBB7AF
MLRLFYIPVAFIFFASSFSNKPTLGSINLVKSNTWFIAGPAKENQEMINAVRQKEGVIRVTAKDFPRGEIELNVTIIPSETNDAIPKNLANASGFVTVIYKSTQLIKLQAREGNPEGTGCIHGGSHPMADLPASPNKFTTLKISWKNFKQDGLVDGRLLNIHNLCKFNFVNYKPISRASLEIKSVIIQN